MPDLSPPYSWSLLLEHGRESESLTRHRTPPAKIFAQRGVPPLRSIVRPGARAGKPSRGWGTGLPR